MSDIELAEDDIDLKELAVAITSEGADGCVKLWSAVLLQMMTDAKQRANNPRAKTIKTQAYAWLRRSNRDFHCVCHMAGCDPDTLLKKIEGSQYLDEAEYMAGLCGTLEGIPRNDKSR